MRAHEYIPATLLLIVILWSALHWIFSDIATDCKGDFVCQVALETPQ